MQYRYRTLAEDSVGPSPRAVILVPAEPGLGVRLPPARTRTLAPDFLRAIGEGDGDVRGR